VTQRRFRLIGGRMISPLRQAEMSEMALSLARMLADQSRYDSKEARKA